MWNLKQRGSESPFLPQGAPLRGFCSWNTHSKREARRPTSGRWGHGPTLGGGRGAAPRRPAAALTAMHCRIIQLCFIRPGPPNFFMSLQKWHSPHSVRRQASHLRHRVRRRRAPAVVRLAANFTAEAGPSFPLGRPTARFCRRAHGVVRWATGLARPHGGGPGARVPLPTPGPRTAGLTEKEGL